MSPKKEIEAKNQSLETAQAKKQVVVANLEQQEDELQAQIDEFESAIEDAQDEIDDIIAQNNASSGGSGGYIGSFEGTLSWPVSSSTPWYNYISSYFGPRPSQQLEHHLTTEQLIYQLVMHQYTHQQMEKL